jgi:predicted ATPase
VPACTCTAVHEPRLVVLTGGPGAGKTATLEMIKHAFCDHVRVVPEAASLILGGGFPRVASPAGRIAAQRAIFFVQREMEAAIESGHPAVLICDRGTVDGAAYWPGPGDLWSSVGTTRAEQLARYHAVIHLRTPSAEGGYNRANPLRTESAAEAALLDARILEVWEGHPHRVVVPNATEFVVKAGRVLELIRAELPECCRYHI